ncbi:hypothetical protein VNO77_42554 [Canavalia gladiata]|uniref:Uncharacterized protein n=1 Tax=Canavalia gladiata TaxID=3824 RepID=A0AAN9PNN1_CANGL
MGTCTSCSWFSNWTFAVSIEDLSVAICDYGKAQRNNLLRASKANKKNSLILQNMLVINGDEGLNLS